MKLKNRVVMSAIGTHESVESEGGKRGFSVETLWRIATVLEIPMDYLFEDEKASKD